MRQAIIAALASLVVGLTGGLSVAEESAAASLAAPGQQSIGPCYTAAIDGVTPWDAIAWNEPLPADLSGVTLKLVGQGVVAGCSVRPAALVLGDAVALEISAMESVAMVSGGSLLVDAAQKNVAIPDSLQAELRRFAGKVVFKGVGANGVTIDLTGATTPIAASFIFDGGTSTLKTRGDWSVLGSGDTPEDPTVLVTGGAQLTYVGKDVDGWLGDYLPDCIVRINSGSTLICADNGGSTFYCRHQWYIEPGATFTISCAPNLFRVQGGAENSAQFYVPAGPGKAIINGSGNIRLATDATPGFACFVGEGATLELASGISSAAAAPIHKYGAGTLTLAGDCSEYSGTLTACAGAVEIPVEEGDMRSIHLATVGEGRVVKTDGGTLTVGPWRPAVDIRGGEVRIPATSAEIAMGYLELPIPAGAVEPSVESVLVVDALGDPIDVLDAELSDGSLLVTLLVNEPIVSSGRLSESISDSTSGVIIIQGPASDDTEAIEVTLDRELPAGCTLQIAGGVSLVSASPIPVASLGQDAHSTLTVNAPLAAEYTVPAGAKLVVAGEAGGLTLSSALNVSRGGTLVIRGAVTAGSTIPCVAGSVVTVEKGARLTLTQNRTFGNDFILHNYGTLDLGATSQGFNSSPALCQVNLYAGSSLVGTGKLWQAGGYHASIYARPYDNAETNFVTVDVPIATSAWAGYKTTFVVAPGLGLRLLNVFTNDGVPCVTGTDIDGLEVAKSTVHVHRPANSECILRGAVRVGSEATLVFERDGDVPGTDTLNYFQECLLDIAGTLQCDARQTIFAQNHLVLHDGARIVGAGESHNYIQKALDICAPSTMAVDGIVSIDAPLCMRDSGEALTFSAGAGGSRPGSYPVVLLNVSVPGSGLVAVNGVSVICAHGVANEPVIVSGPGMALRLAEGVTCSVVEDKVVFSLPAGDDPQYEIGSISHQGSLPPAFVCSDAKYHLCIRGEKLCAENASLSVLVR